MTETTFAGITVAHDDMAGELAPDVVVGVGPAPTTLAWLTPRRHRRRALDLGTGNGIQALLAASHCDEVVATDINPRAVELARANAERNGIANVDVRCGDLFEPVRGEQFDLVVANPPFVVSPDTELQFRDGGPHLCARLFSGLADHLADGGLAIVMVNWPQPAGEPWWRVLRQWTAGAPADALFLRFGMVSVDEYAVQWNRYSPEPAAGAARWLEWFRAQRIERVGAGVVVLRRTSKRPWLRGLDMPHPVDGPCGDHLEAVIDPPPFALPVQLAADTAVVDGYVQRVPGLGVRARISPEAARVLAGGPAPSAGVLDELERLLALGLVEVAAVRTGGYFNVLAVAPPATSSAVSSSGVRSSSTGCSSLSSTGASLMRAFLP